MLKELLSAPSEELGKWSRFLVFQIKLWPQCIKLLQQNHSGRQAAALAYHTIFGIVPLAIVMLMVFQAFPAYRDVGDRVKSFAYEQVHLSTLEYPSDPDKPDESIKLTDQIDSLTENFIANLNTGAITAVSAVIVLWAALGLLTTIERAFNGIWHVGHGRNFVQRIINYWAILTLGPLLLGVGFYVSTHYLVASQIQVGVMTYVRPVLPYLISVIGFFFLYFVMPNTKVSAKSALWGAAVAALIWMAAKYGFRIYVTKFVPQKAIYGVLGIIPLSVLWIYITWLIVLFGLQLTFTTQHLKTLDAAEIASMRKSENYFLVTDFTVIRILAFIVKAFDEKEAPVTAGVICSKLNLPAEFGDKILDHLVKQGLLFRTTEPRTGFVPATDGEKVSLAEICRAVAKADFLQEHQQAETTLKRLIDEHHGKLEGYTLKHVLEEINSQEPEQS